MSAQPARDALPSASARGLGPDGAVVHPIPVPETFRAARRAAWAATAPRWLRDHRPDPALVAAVDGWLRAEWPTRGGAGPDATSPAGPGGGLVVDVGCGAGWLAELVHAAAPEARYLGLDASPVFVEALRARGEQAQLLDLEAEEPAAGRELADLAVACLSFCEMPDLTGPMRTLHDLLRPGGRVLVVTLNPLLQLVRRTGDYPALAAAVAAYRAMAGGATYVTNTLAVAQEPSSTADGPDLSDPGTYVAVLHARDAVLRAGMAAGLTVRDAWSVDGRDTPAWRAAQFEGTVFARPA